MTNQLDPKTSNPVDSSGDQDELALLEDADEAASSKSKPGVQFSLTAAVVVMVLFLRILAVSDWNWDVAADLADSFDFSDAIPILFGTLFELPWLTGVIAAVLLPLALYRLRLIARSPDKNWALADLLIILILSSVLVVLVRTYKMWWAVVVAAVLVIVLMVFNYFVHKGEVHHLLVVASRRVGTLLMVMLLVLSVAVTTPWNVRERIETQSHGVVYGHVIESSPGFLKVLTDEREVVILLQTDVTSRDSEKIREG